MNEEENNLLKLASWVKISSYRNRIMIALGDKLKTPSVLAKDTGIKINHISKFLTELKQNGLIVCINEDAKRGRLYQMTDLGFKVLQKSKMIGD